MNILVIGGHEQNKLWKEALSISLPTDTYISIIQSNEKEIINFNHDLVVCHGNNISDFEKEIVDVSIKEGIPVLSVVDQISEDEFIKLLEMGIRGIVNSNMSIWSIISSFEVLKEGGMYIVPPSKEFNTNIIANGVKPPFNQQEWNVFSLSAKGYSIVEIAKKLKLTEEIVRCYRKKFIEKTNSLSLSMAVDDGLST